jgi:hypothetical protein
MMMMKSGLLWYDPDAKKAARAKVDEAADRYVEKFGVEPNACHVAPGSEAPHDTIAIVSDRLVRPGYFWLGIDDELPVAGPRRSRRDSEAIAITPSTNGPTARRTALRASAPSRRQGVRAAI